MLSAPSAIAGSSRRYKNPDRHHFFVEHDDAGNDETLDADAPRPRNPAGSANTAWTGRKYLANLELPRRSRW